ncbi:MAG: HAMP domain-containing histidine kinase [Deltaproteobacteria bacterium]|nr:HAMP domain-containing histidine kinase [Deltaproteobacteria bacterium]
MNASRGAPPPRIPAPADLHVVTPARIFEANLTSIHRRTDRMFAWLLVAQWGAAIVLSPFIRPFGWEIDAVVLGGAINAAPLLLIRRRPGWWGTRHAVAMAQMLWSAVFITLTGGRIETHFHIFGSLAFLAFYRDWRVIATATLVVAADHLARGLAWPESVYGIANPAWWRFLEHAAWVAFEDVVLVCGCLRAIADMRVVADREAALAALNHEIERRVDARTRELRAANASRQLAEAELRQAHKLESVGRLAAGLAHEINTPIQFVSDSVHFLRDATADLVGVVDKLDTAQGLAHEERADVAYLRDRIPKAFDRSLDGLHRVAAIVQSMKQFAHPDSDEACETDLNAAIESTLIIARNEYKYVADVVTQLGELPLVRCFPGEINQAVLDVLVNAAHAIDDVVRGTDRRGTIAVTTARDGDHAVIAISDTGTGIPADIRDRIFDPFFTTKDVGKGTGQGLATVRSVVVDKHRGSITVDTAPGRTTFELRLPIDGPRPRALAA